MSTITNRDYLLHVLRNAYGRSPEKLREDRLLAADTIERLEAQLAAVKFVVEEMSEVSPQLFKSRVLAIFREDRSVLGDAEL